MRPLLYSWLVDNVIAFIFSIAVPLVLFVVLCVLFVRSYRKPEKVLKPKIVERLEARNRKPKSYLRWWRIEMVVLMFNCLSLVILLICAACGLFDSMVEYHGLNVPPPAFNATHIVFIYIGLALVQGAMAYFGRGYFLGVWSLKFIAMPQTGTVSARSGQTWTTQ